MNKETIKNEKKKKGRKKKEKTEKVRQHPFPFNGYEYCKVSVVNL